MNFDYIDNALGFIEPMTTICLQFPKLRNLVDAQKYIVEQIGYPTNIVDGLFVYPNLITIVFECLENNTCGKHYADQTFFIDDGDDLSYYKKLEYVQSLNEKYSMLEFGILPKSEK